MVSDSHSVTLIQIMPASQLVMRRQRRERIVSLRCDWNARGASSILDVGIAPCVVFSRPLERWLEKASRPPSHTSLMLLEAFFIANAAAACWSRLSAHTMRQWLLFGA